MMGRLHTEQKRQGAQRRRQLYHSEVPARRPECRQPAGHGHKLDRPFHTLTRVLTRVGRDSSKPPQLDGQEGTPPPGRCQQGRPLARFVVHRQRHPYGLFRAKTGGLHPIGPGTSTSLNKLGTRRAAAQVHRMWKFWAHGDPCVDLAWNGEGPYMNSGMGHPDPEIAPESGHREQVGQPGLCGLVPLP